MKRVWFALALLCVIITSAVVVSIKVRHDTANTLTIVQTAEKAARNDDLSGARHLCSQGEQYWKNRDTFFAFFLRHDMTESVSTGLAKLTAYAETEDKDEFLALCREVVLQLEHIREMELPTPPNVF